MLVIYTGVEEPSEPDCPVATPISFAPLSLFTKNFETHRTQGVHHLTFKIENIWGTQKRLRLMAFPALIPKAGPEPVMSLLDA